MLRSSQTDSTRQLRDALYSFKSNSVSSEFLNPSLTEAQIAEIASLTAEDYPAYVEHLIQNARKHLSDASWLQYWKKDQAYTINAGIFFDSEASRLMRELSPVFARYQQNINQLGDLLEVRLREKEKTLLEAIYSTLPPEADPFAHHHAILIAIAI